MRSWLRATAVAVAVLCLSGCAEITNRGGFVDDISDRILFPADTKGHRLLRSYLLTGSLIAYARQSKVTDADKQAIASRMFTALEAANEAFVCAYETPSGCVFFDEKMTRLDYAIYKLALAIFLDSESKEVYAYLRDRVIDEVPVLGKFARGAVRATQAVGDTAGAVYDVAEIVDKLLYYSFRALGTAARIGSLYRDAVEMDMVVIVDNLALYCEDARFPGDPTKRRQGRLALYDNLGRPAVGTATGNYECDEFLTGFFLYYEGQGNLQLWRSYLTSLNGKLRVVIPTADHFIAVSRLILSTCDKIMKGGQDLPNCQGQRADNSKTWVLLYGGHITDPVKASYIKSADDNALSRATDPNFRPKDESVRALLKRIPQ